MPDLVNDPRLAGVNQPGPNPLQDDDPSNDASFDQWKAQADLWREWSAKQDEALAKAVQQGAESGQSGDQVLAGLGFVNAKEQGQHAYTMYGNGGYYSQMGAAADPGWVYNWSTGQKYNKGTSDKYANGELGTRWVPINSTEYAEYAKAQKYSAAGLNNYGAQANAEAFKKAVSAGHFHKDPVSGNYYSGSSPDDPANLWANANGQNLTGRTGGTVGKGGVSSAYGGTGGYAGSSGYGASGYGSSAGGYDPYSMGSYGGSSPGMEASNFSQADLNSALAESMRNDILGQQLGLQKGLEGYAQGSGIYDYMLNQVYGPILGAQFSGNKAGVSQYAQNLNMGSPNQYSVSTSTDPNGSNFSDIGAANDDLDSWVSNVLQNNPQYAAQFNLQSAGGGTPSSIQGGNGGFNAAGYNLPDYNANNIAAGPSNFVAEPGGETKEPTRLPPIDPNASENIDQPPSVSTFASGTPTISRRGESTDIPPDMTGKGTGIVPGQTGPGGVAVGIGNAVGNAVNQGDPTATAAVNQPMTPEHMQSVQQLLDYLKNQGMITPDEYDQRAQKLQQVYTTTNHIPSQPVQALGTPLPQGSYTQTGTDALDPNMNQSWARFLAPTFNKQMEAGDLEQNAIKAALPRGGSQDKAISDSIRGRYGALQNSWQSLVPTALQGVSDIGKEMYFQQPTQSSGALGTAAGLAQGNQQYNLGLQQIASNQQIAKDQASASKWGAVGGALGGLLSAGASLSDERSKKDVHDFDQDLDDVSQMDPKSYKYNGKMGGKKNQPGVSIMAQQAKKIDPKMATTMPNGAQGIKPMEILMKTVNSVKRLEQIVTQLQGAR